MALNHLQVETDPSARCRTYRAQIDRLKAINAELVEALEQLVKVGAANSAQWLIARKAIAKAKGD